MSLRKTPFRSMTRPSFEDVLQIGLKQHATDARIVDERGKAQQPQPQLVGYERSEAALVAMTEKVLAQALGGDLSKQVCLDRAEQTSQEILGVKKQLYNAKPKSVDADGDGGVLPGLKPTHRPREESSWSDPDDELPLSKLRPKMPRVAEPSAAEPPAAELSAAEPSVADSPRPVAVLMLSSWPYKDRSSEPDEDRSSEPDEDGPPNLATWAEWASMSVPPSKVFVHGKYPWKVPDKYSKVIERLPLNKQVPTNWGDKSLVEATQVLLEHAVSDSKTRRLKRERDGQDASTGDFVHYVLVSDDTVPLRPLSELGLKADSSYVSFFMESTTKDQLNAQTAALNNWQPKQGGVLENWWVTELAHDDGVDDEDDEDDDGDGDDGDDDEDDDGDGDDGDDDEDDDGDVDMKDSVGGNCNHSDEPRFYYCEDHDEEGRRQIEPHSQWWAMSSAAAHQCANDGKTVRLMADDYDQLFSKAFDDKVVTNINQRVAADEMVYGTYLRWVGKGLPVVDRRLMAELETGERKLIDGKMTRFSHAEEFATLANLRKGAKDAHIAPFGRKIRQKLEAHEWRSWEKEKKKKKKKKKGEKKE